MLVDSEIVWVKSASMKTTVTHKRTEDPLLAYKSPDYKLINVFLASFHRRGKFVV